VLAQPDWSRCPERSVESHSTRARSSRRIGTSDVQATNRQCGADLMLPVATAIGWYKTAIARILGEPDERKRRYGGGEYCLYASARVLAAEASAVEWRKSEKRRAAAEQAVYTKREALLDAVAAIPIAIPIFDETDADRNEQLLLGAAIAHSNDRLGYDSERSPVSSDDSQKFLQRITVNFLRRQCTPYDAQLARQFGKVGTAEARLDLLCRIYDAIAERYPHLANECEQQMSARKWDEYYGDAIAAPRARCWTT
jgi:hypothetical protein